MNEAQLEASHQHLTRFTRRGAGGGGPYSQGGRRGRQACRAQGEAAAGGQTGGQAVCWAVAGEPSCGARKLWVCRALSDASRGGRCCVLGGASARRARAPGSAGRWRGRGRGQVGSASAHAISGECYDLNAFAAGTQLQIPAQGCPLPASGLVCCLQCLRIHKLIRGVVTTFAK